MINKESTKWWIGTFPSWLVTGLLCVVVFFAKKSLEKINQIDEVIVPRLVKVETRIEIITDDVRDIKSELRRIK
jgi:hypothetical protein